MDLAHPIRDPQQPWTKAHVEISALIYRNAVTGYTVVKARELETQDTFSAVGPLEALVGSLNQGDQLWLEGQWKTHPKFGKQLLVQRATAVPPSSEEGLVRYLQLYVSGVGESLAKKIVDHFGLQTLDVIATQSDRLLEVSGIGKKKAQALGDAIREKKAWADAITHLLGLGLGQHVAVRFLKLYGTSIGEALSADPYTWMGKVSGYGFAAAELLASRLHIALDDPRRIAGAVFHFLVRSSEQGHTYSTHSEIRAHLTSLRIDQLDKGLALLTAQKRIIEDGDAVYLASLHASETRCVEMLCSRLCQSQIKLVHPEDDDKDLNERQRAAVKLALESRFFILTGGPGTGKTRTVKAIVKLAEQHKMKVMLCAPTGRAAQRMAEHSGHPASTVHRLLEWNPISHGFLRSEDNPIECDVLVVDEASMLDLQLTEALLAAAPKHASMIWVGDHHQLPPIGPGHVLRAIMGIEAVPKIELTEVFRQAEESEIIKAAHRILQGQPPEPSERQEMMTLYWRETEQALHKLHQCLMRIPVAFGIDAKHHTQVMSPARRGDLGTENLNRLLQQWLNPHQSAVADYRVGDKVMQTRNNYDHDIFNGDIGEVVDGHAEYLTVNFQGRHIKFEREMRDELTLAYAITVHKSQGSEFDATILLLDSAHHILLSRELLYTAVTRAKQRCIVITTRPALKRCLQTSLQHARNRIQERLSSAMRSSSDHTRS